MAGSQRITAEGAVTTLVSADVLFKDNPSTGSGKIAYSDLAAQIDARYLSGGKLLSSLVPSSFAGGISYKGTVAGASVPASSGATGDYYLISSAGTSQAITWAVGDFAVWNGAAWQKVPMAGAYTTPTDVANAVNPRAPRQGLVFDGTAAGSISFTPGAGDFSLATIARVDALGSTRVIIGGTASPCFILYVNAAGNVAVSSNSVDLLTSTAALVAGKTYSLCYTRSGGIGTIYINGKADASAADATNYSNVANQFGSSNGAFFFEGFIGPIYPYNRAMSAAEVLALYESGAPAAADFNSASNTSIADHAWTGGTYDSFSSANGTTFTAVKASGTGFIGLTSPTPTFSPGQKVLVTGTLTLNGGKLIQPSVYLENTAQLQTVPVGNFSILLTSASAGDKVDFTSTGDANFTVSNITVTRLGVLLAPDAQQLGGGLTWNDTSGNGAHIVVPTSGVTWALSGQGTNRIRGTTSTNGNQQLLGANVLPANSQITRVRARSRTNTPTITIGTASGGAQIVASVALSTTWKDLTIALTGGIVSGASSVWIGSNSTDMVEIDITAEPLSF